MKLQLKMRHRAEWEACSELVALRRAAHPFIVRLEHAFQTPKFFALLLELCAGGSLSDLVTSSVDCTGRCVGLSVERTARYMGQTLLALVHLHQKLGVVYRDVKLDNVLLYNDWTAKLADFGLVKRVGATQSTHMRLVGTMGFLAPELVSHADDYSLNPFKTDAYSFAVTLELTLLGEDVGVVHGDEGRWLTPRSGEESVKLSRIENAVKTRGLHPASFDLLRQLLVFDPSQRSELSSAQVMRHPFFLDALRCSDLEAFLLNDSALRQLPSRLSSDSV
jgi:serine/threonine protein kinase